MKLNNLSRLTALLLALTMFLSSVAWADPVAETEWDSTSYLTMLSAVAEDCLCVTNYASVLPLDQMNGYTCVYEFLSTLGTTDQYQFLADLDNGQYQYLIDEETNKYSSYSINDFLGAYYAHIDGTNGTMLDPLMCTCTNNLNGTYFNYEPGNGKHNEGCPWTEATETSTVIIPNIPQPPLYEGKPEGNQYTETLEYTLPMEEERAVILQTGARAILTSESTTPGVWQVYTGEEWVDIQGDNTNVIEVTEAKLNTIFELTCIAQLRYFDKANSVVLDEVSVTTQAIAEGEYLDKETLNLSLMSREDFPEYNEGKTKYYIYVQYLFKDIEGNVIADKTAADPYRAEQTVGYQYTDTVASPEIIGYKADQTSVSINTSGPVTYTVYYSPAEVKFTVYHYLQNVDNDDYPIGAGNAIKVETKGYTDSMVGSGLELDEENYPGFTALIYDTTVPIAPDGSTTIEIYYNRNYYLMTFNMNGGYGTESVYAKYDTELDPPNQPTRAGYVFGGWDLVKVNGQDVANGIGTADTVPGKMPPENREYKAIWTPGDPVNYTVVYWRENADDENYSYWAQQTQTARPGTLVSGSDDVPQTGTNAVTDKQYFTYNDAKTDKNVEVEGDGSTVVNVYYTRNEYTIHFSGYGTCVLPTHSEACGEPIACTKTEHTHTDSCCSVTHTHTIDCYDNVGDPITGTPQGYDGTPSNGYVYVRSSGWWTYRYIYFGGQWYEYDGYKNSSGVINTSCSGVHVHGDGDCVCSEGLEEHTHSDNCVEYPNCDPSTHTHDHTDACYATNSQSVIYVITAKYEQDISAIWPTYDKMASLPNVRKDDDGYVVNSQGQRFRGWSIPTTDNEVVSKRVTMTDDLCAESGINTATATYSATYTYRLYYMFESFDQETGEKSPTRKQYDSNNAGIGNLYYDSDSDFYQELMYSSNTTFNQKPITGMTAAGTQKETTGSGDNLVIYNWLYYTRDRFTLSFQNIDTVVKTVSNIMYEQPLKEYKDSNNNLLSAFVPAYPSTLEPDAYRFVGWCTIPECLPGTEFDFATETMPNGNLTLYANWQPITHKLEYYEDNTLSDKWGQDEVVDHGTFAPEVEAPTNSPYEFVGWFYKDPTTGEEKAFNTSMPVTQDLVLYAKWAFKVPVEYTIRYVIKDETTGEYVDIAPATTGSALAGTTKTFPAKYSNQLNDGYQTGWYPQTQAHSLTFDVKDLTKNEFTFVYTNVGTATYTVYYITEEPLDADKDNATVNLKLNDNSTEKEYYILHNTQTKTVDLVHVSERYVYVRGYMPDAIQKQLILTSDPDKNIIYFLYTQDSDHVPVQVIHYVQNAEGTGYTIQSEKFRTDLTVNSEYEEDVMNIPYYFFKEAKANGVNVSESAGKVKATIPAEGLTLELWYDREIYDYEFKFLEYGSDEVLAEPVPSSGRYGAKVEQSAKEIPGYELVNPNHQKQTITISSNEADNVKVFYYKEKEATINYEVVGPTGVDVSKVGTVTINKTGEVAGTKVSETVKIKNGTAWGATAAEMPNDKTYKFVGWYDEDDNLLSEEKAWVPTKEDADLWVDGTTYYAKFEYNLTDLTIMKDVTDSTPGNEVSFLFEVTDSAGVLVARFVLQDGESVTVTGLTVGTTYTVKEDETWSVRYKAAAATQTITLSADKTKNVVTVQNSLDSTNDKWLDAETKIENQIPKQSSTQ